jgi:hypothetical protein
MKSERAKVSFKQLVWGQGSEAIQKALKGVQGEMMRA